MSTMSQTPDCSICRAVPTAVTPDAQAVATTRFGPNARQCMARYPEIMLTGQFTITSGETWSAPSWWYAVWASS